MTTPTEGASSSPKGDPLDALVGSAPGHPQWSSTDAGDIPALLARIDALEAMVKERDAEIASLRDSFIEVAVDLNRTATQRNLLFEAVQKDTAEIERLRAAIEQKMDIIQARNLELATLKTAAHAVLDGTERLRAALEGKL